MQSKRRCTADDSSRVRQVNKGVFVYQHKLRCQTREQVWGTKRGEIEDVIYLSGAPDASMRKAYRFLQEDTTDLLLPALRRYFLPAEKTRRETRPGTLVAGMMMRLQYEGAPLFGRATTLWQTKPCLSAHSALSASEEGVWATRKRTAPARHI